MSNLLKVFIALVIFCGGILFCIRIYNFHFKKESFDHGLYKVYNDFSPPNEVQKISRFWQTEKYRNTYFMYLINDIKKSKEETINSKYVPETGELFRFDKGSIIVVRTFNGELKIRYLPTDGSWRTYSFTKDEWGYSE